MKSTLIIAAFFLFFSNVSCKKSDNPPPPPPPPPGKVSLIKEVSTSVNGATATINSYEYNTDNKIKHIKYGDGSYCNFIYSGQSVIADCYDKNAVASVKFTYTLNAAGLVSNVVYNTAPNVMSTFDYNAAGQQVHGLSKDNGTVTAEFFYKYNSNGNKITDSVIKPGGTAINKYEYYTDKNSTTEQVNLGQPFFGTTNKSCLKKIILIAVDGTVTQSPYGVPELNVAGNISKISIVYYGNTSVYSYTYY